MSFALHLLLVTDTKNLVNMPLALFFLAYCFSLSFFLFSISCVVCDLLCLLLLAINTKGLVNMLIFCSLLFQA